MPLHPDWLADVHPNPYIEQLSQGFRRLRFAPGLEQEYRTFMLRERLELRRVGVVGALLVWLAFAGVDIWMIEGSLLAGMLAIRAGVVMLLLLCAGLIRARRHPRLADPLGIACVLTGGLGTAAITALGHGQDPSFPYEGLLLVCIAGYFLIGLRLREALATSLLVVLAYGVLEWLGGVAPAHLFSNLLFLLAGNLIGAIGCYQLELKSREHFLISNLLRIQADQDGLTGLYNRRSFNRELARLWRQAQRDERCLALLLCDVDHFKAYNDNYGHQAGDLALQRVGEVLQRAARRPLDLAARLGGEEFAVLLYDIAPGAAQQRAESLRRDLEACAIAHAGSQTAPVLTLSVGLCCLQPSAELAEDSLYQRADRALYQAKALGRNQVMT